MAMKSNGQWVMDTHLAAGYVHEQRNSLTKGKMTEQ